MSPPENDERRPGGGGVGVEQRASERDKPILPLYRSQEWYDLPDDDPRKLASTVRAADCWYEEGRPARIAQRLVDEEIAFLARIRQASHDLSAAGGWSELTLAPTYEELQRRRAQPLVPAQRAGWAR